MRQNPLATGDLVTPSECAHLLAAASRALAWLPPSASVLEAYAVGGLVRLHLMDPVDGPALAWRPAVPGNAYQAEWSYLGPSGVVVFGLLDGKWLGGPADECDCDCQQAECVECLAIAGRDAQPLPATLRPPSWSNRPPGMVVGAPLLTIRSNRDPA